MNEHLYRAVEEFKRADHLIFVSLKYTRSVDVIRSCIERLINGYDAIIEGLLVQEKEKGRLASIPVSPGSRCDLVRERYAKDQTLQDYMTFYMLLRKMYIGDYQRSGEFRRNVTMTVTVDRQQLQVNIDIITEYYKRSLQLLDYAKGLFDAPKA